MAGNNTLALGSITMICSGVNRFRLIVVHPFDPPLNLNMRISLGGASQGL
jgi:hypothetical protein